MTTAQIQAQTGKTVYEIARAAGVPAQRIYHYLAGRSGLSLEVATRVARAAGVPLDVLATWRGQKKQ